MLLEKALPQRNAYQRKGQFLPENLPQTKRRTPLVKAKQREVAGREIQKESRPRHLRILAYCLLNKTRMNPTGSGRAQ